MIRSGICAITVATALAGCGPTEPFTLYRSSSGDATMRIHLATFDANEAEAYNRENCDVAAGLFQGQEGVKTKFWCEKGRFKK